METTGIKISNWRGAAIFLLTLAGVPIGGWASMYLVGLTGQSSNTPMVFAVPGFIIGPIIGTIIGFKIKHKFIRAVIIVALVMGAWSGSQLF